MSSSWDPRGVRPVTLPDRAQLGSSGVGPAPTFIYALTGKGRKRVRRVSVRLDLNYPLTRYLLRPLSRPIASVLSHSVITPDQVTVFSTAIAGVAAALLAVGHYVPGGLLVLAAAVFDRVDGALARISGRSSARGAFLDSVLDRWCDAALILALGFSNPDSYALLAAIAVSTSLITSYTRARVQSLGADCPEGIATRDVRMLIIAAAALSGFVTLGLAALAALGAVTAVHRLATSMRALRRSRG